MSYILETKAISVNMKTWQHILYAIERIVDRNQRTNFTRTEVVNELKARYHPSVSGALKMLQDDELIEDVGDGEYLYTRYEG